MNPYPWNGIERFGDEVAISEAITGLPATIASSVATLLSPPAWLWRGYTRQGFQRYNDSWWRRGLIVIAAGLLITLATRAPTHMWDALNDLLLSFGDKRKHGVTRGDALIALHGSWNRSRRAGYKVVRARFADGHPTGVVEDFVTGFIGPTGDVWGRPAGLLELPDGSLLVADDGAGILWRVHR